MSESSAVLLRSARLDAASPPRDVLLRDGLVHAIGGRIDVGADTEIIDVDGRNVLPGLWDHHVHFDQWILARQRLDVSAAMSAVETVELVARRLRADRPDVGVPLVGYGFRDGLWPDTPHHDMLDAVSPTVPVVLVSGDLHCCWLNTAAARKYGHAGHPTGILRETEWQMIAERIRGESADVLDGEAAARAAASRGVVGIVDLEAPSCLDTWVRRVGDGLRTLRVSCGVWSTKLDEAIERGLRSGDVIAGTGGLVEMGPFKVIIDGSLNTRSAYCHNPYPGRAAEEHAHGMLLVEEEELVELMGKAWSAGLRCAVHAIGDSANTVALNAFAAVGAKGTIEHAQLLSASDIDRFGQLGVVASVQPEHAMDDRDVAERHWRGRTERAFAYGDLVRAGARLVIGSDAPVAPLDPWLAVSAAVYRSRDGRAPWNPGQTMSVETALASTTRHGRWSLAVGDPADVVVVDLDPYSATPEQLRSMPVAGTLMDGRWTWRHGI